MEHTTKWMHLRRCAIDSTSKFPMESSSIFHWLWKANPHGKDDFNSTWITRRRFDFQNRWNIDKFCTWIFWCRIDVTSKLVAWNNTFFCFFFVPGQVSPLATYSKLNLKLEIWKMFLRRCNFNVKPTWRLNIDIPFYVEMTLLYPA